MGVKVMRMQEGEFVVCATVTDREEVLENGEEVVESKTEENSNNLENQDK